MNFLPRSFAAATLLAMGSLDPAVRAAPATAPAPLAVHLAIIDAENRPLPSVPVRLVFGDAPGWQSAAAGHRCTTDAHGEHRATLPAPIERRSRKMPTNFVSSLFSRAQPTDFLQVAAELDYAGARRLYVIALHHFPDGTVLQEGLSVYTADAAGDFTRQAEFDGREWKMADLGGLVLTTPGHAVAEATLRPAPEEASGHARWTLKLTLRRAAEPVRR